MSFVSTTTREHGIARALDRLGHGGCGGYYESDRGIRCQCGILLTGQVQAALAGMQQAGAAA